MGLAPESPLSAAGALLLPGDGEGFPRLLGQPLCLRWTQVSPQPQPSPSPAPAVPLMPPLPFPSGHLWLSETRGYGLEPDTGSPPGQHVAYRLRESRLVPRACGQDPLDPPRAEETESPWPQRVGHPWVLSPGEGPLALALTPSPPQGKRALAEQRFVELVMVVDHAAVSAGRRPRRRGCPAPPLAPLTPLPVPPVPVLRQPGARPHPEPGNRQPGGCGELPL